MVVAAARRKTTTQREGEGMVYREMRRGALKRLAGSKMTGEKPNHRDCSPEAIVAAAISPGGRSRGLGLGEGT